MPIEDEKAAAFRAIGEVMQASAVTTRALADLLDERGLLALADVRERVRLMAEVLQLAPGVVTAMEHILADDRPAIPVVLN